MSNAKVLVFLSLVAAGGIYVINKNMRSEPIGAAVANASNEPNLLVILPMMLVVATAIILFFCYWKQK